MIIGIGTDIVEIVRVGRMIERHDEHFLRRVFTADEIRYCRERREYLQHFAGHWAAKQAGMRALGAGFARGVSWQDLEVNLELPGRPMLRVVGGLRDHAERQGVDEVLLAMSHCRAYATATAIAVRGD